MDTPKKIPLHVLLHPEDRAALVREAKERRVSLTEIVVRHCRTIAKRQAAADKQEAAC